MYGFRYSAGKYFKFSRKELAQIFWTSLAFGFILSFRKWGAGKEFDLVAGLGNIILGLIVVFLSLAFHVSLQKLVAIKLGYTANYTYWFNGILLSLLLVFVTAGWFAFILPGAVMIELVPRLRMGKFRYGINKKDVARVALAGPIAHILIVLFMGIIYFNTDKSEFVFSIIFVNLLLAIYSSLPIPKIDSPQRMDSGSDGLGLFYFSRTLYVLVLATIIAFTALVLMSINLGYGWLFLLAFIIGCLLSGIYMLTLEQKN
jgi:hypothetical protein